MLFRKAQSNASVKNTTEALKIIFLKIVPQNY